MKKRTLIYLDANAGVPLLPQVKETLQHILWKDHSFANPSSIHQLGRQSQKLLSESREHIAGALGAHPFEIIFTSSGTEANQGVIRCVLEPLFAKKRPVHWVTTTVEHESVRQMIPWVERQGGKVSFIPVDSQGSLQLNQLETLITAQTALVSCLWVNNETGVITDISKVVSLTQSLDVPLHLDGSQALGKLPFSVKSLGAQYLTFSAYKIGALPGTGIVWVQPKMSLDPWLWGHQEKGRRGGTENVLGIVSIAAALKNFNPQAWLERLTPCRDRLQAYLKHFITGTQINGDQAPRIANTLNLNFSGIVGDSLVMALDLEGYQVSSGAACSSGSLEPSSVLLAMGRSKVEARSALRISLVDTLEWSVLETFANTLKRLIDRMRGVL